MNSNIQQKLFNYAETPPTAAWEGIAAALDKTPAFAQKLQQYEEAPPPAVWNKVADQLTAPQPNVVPLRAKLFKYAIAAAVLGVIAAGSLFYLKSGAGSDLATQPQKAIGSDGATTPLDTGTQSGTESTLEKNVAVKTDSDVSEGMATVSDQALVRFSPRVRIVKNGMATHPIEIMPKVKTVIDTELADRYMIATTAGGRVVRLPKKAYSDYACADAYKNYLCKEKMAAIQSKMAASVTTDFTEFMDLLKKLQEN